MKPFEAAVGWNGVPARNAGARESLPAIAATAERVAQVHRSLP